VGDGLYLTTDGGQSWALAFGGVTFSGGSPNLSPLAVDPGDSMTVYAGNGRSIYRSTDGGGTFKQLTATITYGSGVTSISVAPTTGTVWITNYGDGVQNMAKGGTAYALVTGVAPNDIPSSHTSSYWTAVLVAPTDYNIIYACGDSQPHKLYRSIDDGANWSSLDPPGAPIYQLAAYGGNPKRFFARSRGDAITSTDGTNWTPANDNSLPSSGLTQIAVDPSNPMALYAGASNGVYKTTNLFNWSIAVSGMTANAISALAVDSMQSLRIYAGVANAGLFRSSDGANTWGPPNAGGVIPASSPITGLAVDFGSSRTVMAAASVPFRSTDGGANFSPFAMGIATGGVSAVAAAPSAPGTFYVAEAGNAFVIASGGTTWMAAGSGLLGASPTTLLVDPADAMKVWVATDGMGVYATSNGGAAWADSSTGLGGVHVYGLTRDLAGTFFAATDMGVYKSRDGATWQAATATIGTVPVAAIAASPVQAGLVLAGGATGLFRSSDGGASWQPYLSGLLDAGAPPEITAIAVHPSDARGAVVGTWDRGLFRSALP
jgi:hypothetical protein